MHPLMCSRVAQFTGLSYAEILLEDLWQLDQVEAWFSALDSVTFDGLVRFATETNGYCEGLTSEVEALAELDSDQEDGSMPRLWAHYGVDAVCRDPRWNDLEIDEILTGTRGYFFGDSGG